VNNSPYQQTREYEIMQSMKLRLIAASLALMVVASAGIVFAQFSDPEDSPSTVTLDELILVVNPTSPKPNSRAVVEVRAPSLDIARAEIEWLENGKLVDGGVGQTKHSFTAGGAGSAITFTVRVKVLNRETKEESVTVRPASVDLLWQTTSTVPPFYKGKALYPLFGKLSVVALPEVLDQDGRRIPDSELYYTWQKNIEVLGDLSGRGRNILALVTPELRFPFTVSVVVELADGTEVASDTITINISSPKVLVYENSPLYGVLFNRELGESASLVGQEVVFEVFPLFFGSQNRGGLSYVWYVNGVSMADFSGPSITLRKTGDEVGGASVSVHVSGGNLFTESIGRTINVALGR